MNYIKLINQFWKLRRSKRITSKQADLYFYLIQECNERDWENPFECANTSIIPRIDMQEPTLIDARNRLKQLGLIDFKGGRRNEASPIYTILYLNELSKDREGNLNSLSRNRGESIVNTEEKAGMNDEHLKEETKQNQKEEKEGGEPPPENSELVLFKKFQDWQSKNAPRVLSLKEPFTLEQYMEIKRKYTAENLKEILIAMHNYKPLLSKNISAYLTLLNWAKRRDAETGKGSDTEKPVLNAPNYRLKKIS